MDSSHKLRVLLLVDWFNVGGTKTHALSLASDFISRGMKVTIAGTKGPLSRMFRRAGCSVHFIPFRGSRTTSKQMAISEQLEKMIMQEKISIIHAHHPGCAMYASQVAKRHGIPLLLSVHGTFYNKLTLLPATRICQAVISVSPSIQNFLSGMRIPSHLIPNGINVQEFRKGEDTHLRKAFGIPQEAPVIVYPARLEGQKARIGLQVIEACQQLRKDGFPDLHCFIAGYGILINKVRAAAEQWNTRHGDSFIHVLGRYYDMPALYSLASCVVATGRSGLEVLACERPLIGAGIQGFFGHVHPDSFVEGWKCLFGDHRYKRLPPSNSYLIADHLRKVLQCPEEQKKSEGELGRNYILDEFELSQVNDQLIALYGSLLST